MRKISVLALCLFVAPGHAEMSCGKPDDVNQMVKEIYIQIYCAGAASIQECEQFSGLGTVAAGGAVAAIAARGISRAARPDTPSVCPGRKGAFNFSLVPSADASSCVVDFKAVDQEVSRYMSETEREMARVQSYQDEQIRSQLRNMSDSVEQQRYHGAPKNWDGQLAQKKIDKEYKAASEAIDRRMMPKVTDAFQSLIAQNPGPDKAKAETLLRQLKSAGDTAEARMARYAALDDLMDLYKIRRPSGMSTIGPVAQDKLVHAVEKAAQERTLDLVSNKRFYYSELAKLGKAPGEALFLDLTPAEDYELERMRNESGSARSSAMPEGNNRRGAGHFERRYPLMAQEPRISDDFRHLVAQESQLDNIATTRSAAASRGVAGSISSMDDATRAVRDLPRAPSGSVAAVERDIIQKRFESLQAGKGWTLSPAAIKNFGLQDSLAAARNAMGRGGVLMARMGLRGLSVASGVLGVAEIASAAVGAVLPESVNCQKACSPYFNRDNSCNPVVAPTDRVVSFLKLDAAKQIEELKCPEMCEVLKGVYAQASPTANWTVQCTDDTSSGFTLKSKGHRGEIKVIPGSHTAKMRFEKFPNFAANREVLLNDGKVTSVKIPKAGAARTREAHERMLSLADPRFYNEVSAAQMDKPEKRWQIQARDIRDLVASLRYATAEAGACCEQSKGRRPAGTTPGANRCRGYGVDAGTPAPPTDQNDPAATSR
jgi:hypothetical protein